MRLITVLMTATVLVLIMTAILSGIGYTLDPDFSFVKVAAPYAQVLYILTHEFDHDIIGGKKKTNSMVQLSAGAVGSKTEAADGNSNCSGN